MANKTKKETLFQKLKTSFFIGILLVIVGIFFLDFWKGSAVGAGLVKYELDVESGMSPVKITEQLSKSGMIRSSSYFLGLIKLTRTGNKLKTGVYELNDGMSARKILEVLVEGKVKLVNFTIPEGYTNKQIADVFFRKKFVSSKEEALRFFADPNIIKKYNISANSLEGYLYPDTYSIPMDYPIQKITELMVKRFFAKLATIPEAKNIKPSQLQEKLILASIVEREAVRSEERPLMAGVFIKRIHDGIKLESCATIQYLFDKPKKRLFESDLKRESPYNTYMNEGWPPGPISNPGLPALIAAFKPVVTDKLFFVLKPDGSHHFSSSFKEHLDAKKKYIDSQYSLPTKPGETNP